jgi:hypothetical protein
LFYDPDKEKLSFTSKVKFVDKNSGIIEELTLVAISSFWLKFDPTSLWFFGTPTTKDIAFLDNFGYQ